MIESIYFSLLLIILLTGTIGFYLLIKDLIDYLTSDGYENIKVFDHMELYDMQRKATKNTRAANADEKRFHKWIKEECETCAACCQPNHRNLIVHHCEGSTFRHNKTLIGHWFVLGLCPSCDDIVTNGSKNKFRELFGSQAGCWDSLIFEYKVLTGNHPPIEVRQAILNWGR